MQEIRIKQVVPENLCRSCDVCCRFSQEASIYAPHLTQEDEKQLFKAGLSQQLVRNNRLVLKSFQSLFLCPCFVPAENRCKLYNWRPLECQIYPFLLVSKNKKIFLALDKKCPFARENLAKNQTQYIAYLREFFNSPETKQLLLKTTNFFGDYSNDTDIVYLEELFTP
jgi:Fe-S-cluster containining protein